jgi:hypothetical protein
MHGRYRCCSVKFCLCPVKPCLAGVLVKIINDKAADLINLKISKVGGLTKARAVRDLAVAQGIPMNIEDTW